MPTAKPLLDRLKELDEKVFENLTFDLAVAAGLRNAIWRTPGSDEGRDIEGETISVDYSGYHVVARWYLECKRYKGSVDWPTVWEKISYADSHRADYLLVVTPAHLTPQCKTQIANWNRNGRRPAIRSWDAAVLESVLQRHPAVLLKYGLSDDTGLVPASFLSLAQWTASVIQCAYGTAVCRDQITPSLEAAAALSELLTVRIQQVHQGNRWVKYPFDAKQDLYDWVDLTGNSGLLSSFDRYGLRAMLAVIRHVSTGASTNAALIQPPLTLSLSGLQQPPSAATKFLSEISVMANTAVYVDDSGIKLSPREDL